MPNHRKRCYLAAFVGLTALTASCGSSQPSAGDADLASPLAELLGVELNAAGEPVFELDAALDDAVQDCMASVGFDWYPTQEEISPPANEQLQTGEPTDLGLGVSTRYFSATDLPAGIVGFDPAAPTQGESPILNRNERYLSTLTAEEVNAYDAALYGEIDLEEVERVEEEQGQAAAIAYAAEAQTGGCLSKAETDPVFVRIQTLREVYGEQLEDLELRALADDRTLDFESDVADCMFEQGWGYPGQTDLRASFEQELEGLLDSLDSDRDRLLDEGALEASIQELSALQRNEIDFAATLHNCKGDEASYANLLATIRADLEAEFIEQNAVGLEQISGN